MSEISRPHEQSVGIKSEDKTTPESVDIIFKEIENSEIARDFYKLLRSVADVNQMHTELKETIKYLSTRTDSIGVENTQAIKKLLLELKDLCDPSKGLEMARNNMLRSFRVSTINPDRQPSQEELEDDLNQAIFQKISSLQRIINETKNVAERGA